MALVSVFIVELALFYFSGTDVATTSLFEVLVNPSIIMSNGWYLAMVAIISVSIAATLIPSFIIQANQWAYFAVGCIIFITYVQAFVRFAQFINGALAVSMAPEFTTIITALITAPLIILYITAMVEWTRFNQ